MGSNSRLTSPRTISGQTTAAFRDNYEPFLAWMKTPEGKSAGFGSEGRKTSHFGIEPGQGGGRRTIPSYVEILSTMDTC